MHHIFVSYSRADTAWVQGLVARLKLRGHEVWLDQADIPVTVVWMREVRDAIEESALFLRCDSATFRASSSCSAEVSLALQTFKPQFLVTVGDDLDSSAAKVDQTVRAISPARAQRTELRVLARDWDRADRPRNRLMSGLRTRRFARTLDQPPPPSEVEHSFLRASRTRARRRSVIGSVTVLITIVALLATFVFQAAQKKINAENSQEAVAYSTERDGLSAVVQDPYSGLALAAHDGRSEAATNADVVSQALAAATPDNAFAVANARRFVVRPVGARVIVADAHGHQWQRPATATGTQAAIRMRPPVPLSAAPVPGRLTASAQADSGFVVVRKSGRLWRKILFDGPVRALAFSPDSRFLAAAIGEQVEVTDLSTGLIRQHMRGATGPLLDIAWSADARHIWALDARRVFSWPTGDSYTLIDNPSANYNSVLPAASPGEVWIVGVHTLTKINVMTGAALEHRTIADTIGSAGAPPDGSIALVSGQRYLWVVPLSGSGRIRRLQVKSCTLGRPTFRDDATAYVPCVGGVLMAVAMPSGRITAKMAISQAGAFGVQAVPGQGVVYVGDQAGILYAVDGSQVTRLEAVECDVDISRIAVAPGDRAVLPVGSGSGLGTCTHIGLRGSAVPTDTSGWTWNAVLEEQSVSIYATSVTFNRTGQNFAIGYSDGTITMHPTVNITPSVNIDTAVGLVRDMLMLNDGNLIVVTSAGMVLRVPFCDSCLSDAALAKVAAAHLALASRLGLAREQAKSKR